MRRLMPAVAAMAALLAACQKSPSTSPAGPAPLALEGPETWNIDGKDVSVLRTYYLELPQGLQYTIETPHDFGPPGDVKLTRPEALKIALPLLKYACDKRLFTRSAIEKNGTPQAAKGIGVVLIQQMGENARGYRISLSLDEIKAAASLK